MADLTGDGILDITSGQYMPGHINLFEGKEDGYAKKRVLEEALDKSAKQDGSNTDVTMATMNLVDWDGDGDKDMVIGSTSGTIAVNINEGDGKVAKFGARKPVVGPDQKPLKVSQKSDPLPVDWDHDGVLDLLVGCEAGDVTFFRGRKDRTFETGVSIFSGKTLPAKPGYGNVKELLGDKAPTPGYRLRLDVADWNGDGKPDLLIGNCEADKKNENTIHGFVYLLLAE